MANTHRDDNRRVVVTGLGVVSSLGIGWQEFWPNIMAGKSGISRVESFDTTPYDRHYAGEVKNFDPAKFMNPRKAARIGRASQMAIAASKLAAQDAGLDLEQLKKLKIGTCIGTTLGESQLIEAMIKSNIGRKKLEVKEIFAAAYPASSIASNVAGELKLSENCVMFSTACAAGNYAIGHSFDLIKAGKVDFMIAGGSDAFSRIAFTGFCRLFAIAPLKCQPFDKNRKGMIPGEGAAMLLLESYENAKKRGVEIYAEILTYALCCDASHMTIPSKQGIVNVMESAIKSSKKSKSSVGYISAHGTGTIENDKAESEAILEIFNKEAINIPVSSIKSMLGHAMGTSSAFESMACCLAVKRNEIPPTINFETPDEECQINCVPNRGISQQVSLALNNSFAFGGNNACVVFTKV